MTGTEKRVGYASRLSTLSKSRGDPASRTRNCKWSWMTWREASLTLRRRRSNLSLISKACKRDSRMRRHAQILLRQTLTRKSSSWWGQGRLLTSATSRSNSSTISLLRLKPKRRTWKSACRSTPILRKGEMVIHHLFLHNKWSVLQSHFNNNLRPKSWLHLSTRSLCHRIPLWMRKWMKLREMEKF